MPAELLDNQHEVSLPDGSMALVFGTEDTGYLALGYPTIDQTDPANGDVQRVREDGVAFGEDYLGSKTYTFEVGALFDKEPDPHYAVTEALDTLQSVWQDERFRDVSGAYAVLRSNIGGRVTRCYGRPRRYADTPSRLTHKGYTPVIMDFSVSDGRWYDDEEQVVATPLISPVSGYLMPPLMAPLTTEGSGDAEAVMTVSGKKATWPVIELHCPNGATNPSLQIGNEFTVTLNAIIPANSVVTVDPRPWSRSVLRQDGASFAGKLSYDTPPLRRMLVKAGTHVLTFQAIDETGTAYAQVRWRNARSRP